ncbi:hypothetical protein L6452_18246 [Arctium lappa]|uniref:Uncharacterized protein n=1 Tax=Arctium lappa TaxID=4217 RepID=A0ACB9C5T4_ARCLA|nr:hypothetical protein L6452_18246 [Arctium lappa]
MNTSSLTKVPQIFEESHFRSMTSCVPSLVRIEKRVVKRLILEKKMMSLQRRKEVPRLMTLISLKIMFKVLVDLKDQQVV